MKLILVRHGISTHNVSSLISGGKSDPDLSPEGIRQIKEVREYFDEDQVDAVYASPLSRAYQTAELLTNKKKKITVDQRLIEMNFGSWEGRNAKPLYERYPDAFDYMGMFSPNFVKYVQDAESYDDLIERCRSFMNDLKHNSPGKTVLVVCHGFTIRGILAGLFHLNISDIGASKNVSFTEINFDEKHFWRPRLMSYNRKTPAYYATKKKFEK